MAQDFAAYGPSHWIVLAVFAAGAAGLVVLGRVHPGRAPSRVLAVLVLALQLSIQAYSLAPSRFAIDHSLPLQLSDLAGYVTAYALWSHRQWAFTLTYYWGLTLSVQALVSPALRGPDFPHITFIAFWGIHLLAVWAAIYLTWGVRMRPDWRGYRLAVVVTTAWAVTMLVFNSVAGTNYGFLNGKPAQTSLLDLFGPWPWYLLPEFLLVWGVWALMTLPWTMRRHLVPKGTAS
ncbi:YwaF family protein [Actinokineospora sp. HUAS TT18]|uniref:YwaF family protein n=1 Tax=Actinokineospora sp. HUAS TT18 TaxID=3447451 RepID=UPI003F525B85